VLAHILSLAGVAGGSYPTRETGHGRWNASPDIADIRTKMERIERERNSVVERLARIATLAENIREDLRDQRYGGGGGRGYTSRRQATTPAGGSNDKEQ